MSDSVKPFLIHVDTFEGGKNYYLDIQHMSQLDCNEEEEMNAVLELDVYSKEDLLSMLESAKKDFETCREHLNDDGVNFDVALNDLKMIAKQVVRIEKCLGNKVAKEEDEKATAKGAREMYESYKSVLSEQEQKVLELRSGIYDGVPKTLYECSEILGIGRESIRQIQKRAQKKLKEAANINF